MSGRGRGFLLESSLGQPLREPRGSPEEAEEKKRSPPPVAPQASRSSTLNADAREFVPRSFSVVPQPAAPPPPRPITGRPTSTQFEDSHNEQRPSHYVGHQRNAYPSEDGYGEEQDPMQVLHEAVEKIATNPGCYDEVLGEILEAFSNARLQDDDCDMAADIIVNKAIEDSNFRYHAALLARALTEKLQDARIPDHVMQRCHIEHMKRDDLLYSEEGRAKLVGFTFFMAEMFMNYPVVAKGIEKKALTLMNGIFDLLDSMMKVLRDEYWPAIVCVIKLCGKEMEGLERGEYGEEFSKKSRLVRFFKRLEDLYEGGICKPKFKLQVERLNNLKESKWKDPTPTRAPDQPPYVAQPNPYTAENGWNNGFDPDEFVQPEVEEEYYADMDDEALAFFEQFLRDSNQL